MLTHPTLDKLHALGLMGMARALSDQMDNPDHLGLTFEERLGLMVDREAQDRNNRRLERNLKTAKLRHDACVEDIDFRHPRGLDRNLVMTLASAQWVASHQSVIVVGPTGAGKTFIACALAQAAIRQGHTALYLRTPRLFGDLALARADGRFSRLMASWARVDVLLLDDFLLRPLTPDQAADLLEIIEDRHQLHSTILTSQLPVKLWHDALGEPTIADAILDRLVHSAHRIELRGASIRRAAENRPDPAQELSEPVTSRNRRATKPQAARR